MHKKLKLLIGIPTLLMMTSVAVPSQAAVLIGNSQPLPGSVVSLHSISPSQVQVIYPTSSPAVPTTITSPSQTSPSWSSTPPSTSVYTQSPPVNVWTAASSNRSVITIGQSNPNGSVVSLKNIHNQTASAPASTPISGTQPAAGTSGTSGTSATTSTIPATTPSLPTIPAVTSLTADEQQMVDMINQERTAAGVSPLKVDFRLVSVGQAKANDMKTNNYFDHTSPTYGSPWAMMQQEGLTVNWAGENIAGNDSVSGAMSALMQDPAHKANILDPRFTAVGIGISYGTAYGNIYVQEFLQE